MTSSSVSPSSSTTPEKVSFARQVVERVESWGLVFGPDWEVVVTSKLVITYPLHVQDRKSFFWVNLGGAWRRWVCW